MSPNLVQRLSAEALGTLLLVYFGAAAALAATAGSLGVALAYAVALALAVWIFSAVSGAYVNPTVTIALAGRGRFAWRDVLAQVVGGVLAGLLAWATYGKAGITAGLGGAVHLNPAATVVVGLAVEALAAFLLVLAYYALFVEERVSRAAPGLGGGQRLLGRPVDLRGRLAGRRHRRGVPLRRAHRRATADRATRGTRRARRRAPGLTPAHRRHGPTQAAGTTTDRAQAGTVVNGIKRWCPVAVATSSSSAIASLNGTTPPTPDKAANPRQGCGMPDGSADTATVASVRRRQSHPRHAMVASGRVAGDTDSRRNRRPSAAVNRSNHPASRPADHCHLPRPERIGLQTTGGSNGYPWATIAADGTGSAETGQPFSSLRSIPSAAARESIVK